MIALTSAATLGTGGIVTADNAPDASDCKAIYEGCRSYFDKSWKKSYRMPADTEMKRSGFTMCADHMFKCEEQSKWPGDYKSYFENK